MKFKAQQKSTFYNRRTRKQKKVTLTCHNSIKNINPIDLD